MGNIDDKIKHCDCKEWAISMPQIIGAQLFVNSRGITYNGAPFKFCPWCGEKLPRCNDLSNTIMSGEVKIYGDNGQRIRHWKDGKDVERESDLI